MSLLRKYKKIRVAWKTKQHLPRLLKVRFQAGLHKVGSGTDFRSLGRLSPLKHNSRTLFGLVYQTQTGSMDPTRYPFPYQKTEQELLAEQPQIFEFLKTTFMSMTVGYLDHGHMVHLLAPEPPHIHAFVQEASKEQSVSFFSNEQFLHLIFGAAAQPINVDELLLATLKISKNTGNFDPREIKKVCSNLRIINWQ